MAFKKLQERINHILKKSDILDKPFDGQITDCQVNENFKRTELILVGSYGDKTGEFSMLINSTDEVYLANTFGADWSKLKQQAQYRIKAVDTGEVFKDHPVLRIEVAEL